MKNINFNIKDRKVLTLGLCLILVCVFTLTIAYAALNAVLTINGNSEVVASTWDIYLANPKVTDGSATTTVPEIKTSSSLEFSTTLNMPGDFYEFTVDVVNDGSIDAMIENVVKNPELTTEQSKYLDYVVSYQNGEVITTKQTLTHGTSMPIKVRVEYRRDISASDLPTTQTKLDLSLTLEYVQSDGTGNRVPNNGLPVEISANGNINDIGTIVTIGDQQFYTIGTEGDNVKLLSMYNLYIGGVFKDNAWTAYGDEATGMQDENMRGWVLSQSEKKGTTAFSDTNSVYEGSIVEGYINNYHNLLEANFGVDVVEARLITYAELTNEKIGCNGSDCDDAPAFITSTSYWCEPSRNYYAYCVYYYGALSSDYYDTVRRLGVRPVIVISNDYFN